MRKKDIAKKVFEENVNFELLKKEINSDSWLKSQSVELLACNGLVINHFNYDLIVKAIAIAGYKHPHADRTWNTMRDISIELMKKYL